MIQYSELFPKDNETFCLRLDSKTGTLPKGTYRFFDSHCAEQKCDCRRIAVSVLNEKGKDLAHIAFGFDPDAEEAGPYLEPFMPQSRHAELLLEIFTELVNTEAAFLEHLYSHYRLAREKIDGKKYKGRSFPKPGSVVRVPVEAPDDSDMFAEFEELLSAMVRSKPRPDSKKRKGKQPLLFEEPAIAGDASGDPGDGRATAQALLSDMLRELKRKKFSGVSEAERVIDGNPDLAFPLIDLLAEEGARDAEDQDDRIHACLILLRAVFERLRVDLERRRPESAALNEALQRHIADKLFHSGPASFLGAEVVRNLADCRLEPLPLLAEAFQRMMSDSFDGKVVPFTGGDPLAEIVQAMAEMGAESVFDRFSIITDRFRLAPEEMQLQLAAEMAVHKSPVLREVAGLMSFHPLVGVRDKFPAILAAAGGDKITPETLRRLILTRNWHAGTVRADIDRTIADARRAGVQCARVRETEITEILASPVDGASAQGFWMIGREKGQYVVASLLVKLSEGIVDAWVTPPLPAAEMKRMSQAFKMDGGAQPVAAWLLERMVAHGLATGLCRNTTVPAGLLEVAEIMGIPGWRPEPVDPGKLLVSLRGELAPRIPSAVGKVLAESESWPMSLPFAASWFEDDRDVDELLSRQLTAKRLTAAACGRAADAVVSEILQPRRSQWVERLALTTLWLNAATGRPQLAPEKMLLVAEHVAAAESLGGAGLMRGVAQMTVHAYLGRRAGE
ncbi:MAG: hypothetical protein HYS23_02625 [Geobacter sp.]|nr:hypothetical protein [Geobacter sp.]